MYPSGVILAVISYQTTSARLEIRLERTESGIGKSLGKRSLFRHRRAAGCRLGGRDSSPLSVGFAAGASFFLYKPIDKDRLLKLARATQGAMEHERRRTRRVTIPSKVRLKFGKEDLESETIDEILQEFLLSLAPME
jgi:hypothetical protein